MTSCCWFPSLELKIDVEVIGTEVVSIESIDDVGIGRVGCYREEVDGCQEGCVREIVIIDDVGH